MIRPFAASFACYPLVPRYVSRFSNATSDTRGMPRTFTKWQLPQLWYSRRAIVPGFTDCHRAQPRCCVGVGDFWQVPRPSRAPLQKPRAAPRAARTIGPTGKPP